jgi:hypothetical protein
MADDDDDALEIDQWDNTVGDDDELDTLWGNLTTAAGPGKSAEIEQRLGTHLAGLGARWRRIAEGLILAAPEASLQPPDPAKDWRVTLHRHFIRDRPLPVNEAAAALIAFQTTGRSPNWHGMAAQTSLRLLISYVRDMRAAVVAMEASGPSGADAATLYALSSELFDFSMVLPPEDGDAFRDDPAIAGMMADILRAITDAVLRGKAGRATDAEKARALVEVTIRQLGLASDVIH